jgi:hypothetical protein
VSKIMKATICVALLIASAWSAFAVDQTTLMEQTRGSRLFSGFAQGVGEGSNCWMPTADQSEYGADTRGLRHRGSCGETGAVLPK